MDEGWQAISGLFLPIPKPYHLGCYSQDFEAAFGFTAGGRKKPEGRIQESKFRRLKEKALFWILNS
ncbi:MAG: hypothetical protein Q8O18_08595, partial [Deltaproteobacteria bacterium]|nr:hypothetical protein [Deltaproteobacteria bacterium]